MLVLKGAVFQGVKHFKRRLERADFRDAFRNATGESLFKGTLNVRVGRCIPAKEHFRIQGKDFGEPEQDLLLEVCRINGLWAYRIRPYNLTTGAGGHGDSVLEIGCSQEIPHDPSGREGVEVLLFRNGTELPHD
jgi:hypothetical protein